MRIYGVVGWMTLILVVAGCSAIGVPASSDPNVKLSQAAHLSNRLGRVGVAKRLILEAIDIFKKRGDELGLVRAYYDYGVHIRTFGEDVIYAVPGYQYHEANPSKKQIDRSIEYFKKSLVLANKNNFHFEMGRIYFVLGATYYFAKERNKACKTFDQSLEEFRKDLRAKESTAAPARNVALSKRVQSAKKELKCS